MLDSVFDGWRPESFRNVFAPQPHRSFAAATFEPSGSIEWIAKAQQLARSGYIQVGLFLFIALWNAWHFRRVFDRTAPRPATRNDRASRIPRIYETLSQAARIVALVFIVLAASEAEYQSFNAVTIGVIFVLGLLRLVGGPVWRHTFLHQINLLVFTQFLIFAASEFLPQAVVGSDYKPNRWVLAAALSLAAASALALVTPRTWDPPPMDLHLSLRAPEPKPSPEETASWLQFYLTYEYLTPMIWKGFRKTLEMVDLPGLPWYDEPARLLTIVLKAREKSKQRTIWTLARFQAVEIITMAVWAILAFSVELITPFALYNLLAYIGNPEDALLNPVVWLILMFCGPMARTLCFQQYIFNSTRLIVRVKAGFTQELYHRAMSSMELEEDVINAIETRGKKTEGMKSTSTGRLANLMSSDVDAIYRARDFIMATTGIPAGIILSCIGLYKVIGWSSFVGTVFMIIMTPVPAYIAQLMGSSQRKVKLAQDSRISLITEYLSSIKAIKYFAWEDAMVKHVQEARAKEQKDLWRITLLLTLMAEMSELIPAVALALMFITYAAILQQPLNASIAFTTLTLVNTMRRNIGMMSFFSRSAVNAWISMDRLDRYFRSTAPIARYPVGPLSIKNATFRRHKNATFTLKDISIDFVQGGLNVVSGQSGSGKTTLLLAILGETLIEGGSVTRPDDVAFASQTAWLQSETIRDNVLFHSEFEQARYDRVIKACALDVDLDEMPKGDGTEVGENGTALSGGQKARVALARALYSKAPLLLLDDTFSALDAKTAAIVWKHCFCGDLLQGRTTILVTQMPWVPAQADFSIVLENGVIKSAEPNIGVVRKPVTLEHGIPEPESTPDTSASVNGSSNGTGNGTGNGIAAPTDAKPADTKPKTDEIADEMKASGSSNRLMFFQYMLHFGGPLYAVFAILTSIFVNVVFIGTSWWLAYWVDSYKSEATVNIAFYLGIYILFTIGSILVDALCFLTYANGAWIAARRLHQACLRSVMNVSLAWWKKVPVGRVVNRFSSDMSSLDNQLVHMLQAFLEAIIQIFLRLGAVSSILPIFILPGIFTCFVGAIAGEMYTRTAVVVRRLVSSSQSPVFSQFSDSMAGLAVIRARGSMPQVFRDKLAERLRDYSRAQEANFNINRWVSVRVDFVTALVSLCAGIIAVAKTGEFDAGLVGFSLANASGLGDTIMMLVRSMNELEVEMQSFHRVKEYSNLEPEEKTDDAHKQELLAIQTDADREEQIMPKNWPRSGSVELRNVTVKYDEDGPEILKDINLKFEAGERVAVVGRTGSGKSTLVLSLLRFTNIVEGKILYDGVDITAVPRKALRQALTIIPQEATLFNGTVGSNLDPSGEIPESRIQKAIESCVDIASFQFHTSEEPEEASNGNGASSQEDEATKPTEETPLLAANNTEAANGAINIAKAASGLSLATQVNAKGENFSHGQRQVLSLCRALVRKSRLMLLDEATASMDYETDRGIQAILRADLEADGDASRTLVTIAHRLRTIVDYDKVVVLGAGRVLEVGSPAELYKAKGQFYDMVRHSGEGEELAALLEAN
ncbi:P-loop containing nucleoside triphosphate hydrolase protein [Thozetella sp. PMI_491]|nr:P-loop containing nucleoside triphosphate hydrolase protein [Thozetella sp. PMI_491]